MKQKILAYVQAHKAVSAVVGVVIVGGTYFALFGGKDQEPPRYILAEARKGALVVSVSGSGQITAENQVDVKAKASGDIVQVPGVAGQTAKAGAALAYIDARDAQKAVRDAQANLDAANLALEKLKKPADALSKLQAENAIASAKESKQKAEDDLRKAYDDAFTAISNAFLDIPEVMTGLRDIILDNDIAPSQTNMDYYAGQSYLYDGNALRYKDDANAAYQSARAAYDNNFIDYKSATRSQDAFATRALLDQTYATVKGIADAVKSIDNLIRFYKDTIEAKNQNPVALSATHLDRLNAYTGTTNTHVSGILSIKNSIQNSALTIDSSSRTIFEKQASLEKLNAGADALDVASQELTVQQRKNALLDAQQKLADYAVRAPFDGIVAKISVKKGDSVSAGAVAATIITRQRTAVISLNEVDVSRVSVGQKAAITFDAVADLSLSGTVSEIDSIGTVSQGVVTYNVKILFDTQDERVKPGMSATASIVTDTREGALLAPNSAVKSQGAMRYVEAFNPPIDAKGPGGAVSAARPDRKPVTTGLSNDTFTEILSGLSEGEQIVVRTLTGGAAAMQQAPTIFGAPGGNRGGAGTGRVLR